MHAGTVPKIEAHASEMIVMEIQWTIRSRCWMYCDKCEYFGLLAMTRAAQLKDRLELVPIEPDEAHKD